MGANEFRYRLRKQMDKVVAEDVGRHAIASQPFNTLFRKTIYRLCVEIAHCFIYS